jgi:hypothetical protein
MLPPLRSWLKKYQGRDGKIIENIKVAYRLTETSKKSGVPWKGNALRHSFASYRLAEIQSAPQVALEMGNSPAIIFSNYRELVPREQATLWWNLSTATKLENVRKSPYRDVGWHGWYSTGPLPAQAGHSLR